MSSESIVKAEIKDQINENNFHIHSKPSTTRNLDIELNEDFPICETSEVKKRPLLSINLRRPFIAPARDAKNIVEIKKDTNGHLPMLLRRNWRTTLRKAPSPSKPARVNTGGKAGRHRRGSNGTGCPPPPAKIRRDA